MGARGVWRRNRSDGIVELSPMLSPLESGDRWLIIFTVVMAAVGLFMAEMMPAKVLLAVFASAVAGEVVLGAKALILLVLRPAAEIHEVPRFSRRVRAG